MSAEIERIEDEIAATRARLDARLSGLGNSLEPSAVIRNLVGGSDLISQKNMQNVVSKAKQNPFSASLIGAGIAGFLLPTNKTAELREKASAVSDNVADTMRSAKTAASEKVAEGVNEISEQAERSVTHAKASAEGASDWIKENPVAVGLLALAAGAAVSSIFAAKPKKTRLAASEELHDKAASAGSEQKVSKKPDVKKKPVRRAKAAQAMKKAMVDSATKAPSTDNMPMSNINGKADSA